MLIWFVFSGIVAALVSVLLFFAVIRDDQVHEGSVPGVAWLLFVLLAVVAVLDGILGVCIFRGARWAWKTAVVLLTMSIIAELAVLVFTGGAASAPVADAVGLWVLRNRKVREWCASPAPENPDDRIWGKGP